MNLNDLYSQYASNPRDANLKPLLGAVRKFSLAVGREMFLHSRDVSDEWRDICEDTATDIICIVVKNAEPIRWFSGWSKRIIRNRLIDWGRKESAYRKQVLSLDDPDVKKYVEEFIHDPAPLPDQKAYYQEVLSKLTEDERKLFDMKVYGLEESEIATELGNIDERTVRRYWANLCDKLRDIHNNRK